MKAKDSAVGSSIDHHVVGGYRFLMRFYCPGDEIYIFDISRGAYIARFLAEMLDYVGLLSDARHSRKRAHPHSVIRRMQLDESYRPGNLIIGGGGRGVRVAPKQHGTGDWVCVSEEGDPVGAVWIKRTAVEKAAACELGLQYENP